MRDNESGNYWWQRIILQFYVPWIPNDHVQQINLPQRVLNIRMNYIHPNLHNLYTSKLTWNIHKNKYMQRHARALYIHIVLLYLLAIHHTTLISVCIKYLIDSVITCCLNNSYLCMYAIRSLIQNKLSLKSTWYNYSLDNHFQDNNSYCHCANSKTL